MSNQNAREEALFSGAIQLPRNQRCDYLKAACGSDAALYEHVWALVRAHDGDGLMADAANPTLAVGSTEIFCHVGEKAGDRIGRYKLLEEIGQGGCGVVFAAEQTEPLRRRVALKVIKLGMDTRDVIARFEAERQALSMMEHPNIAKVFDAGSTEAGRPYFVMELVRGIKITEYCDHHQLSANERLELFTQVCQAIHHAHQKGIIHRDIKPSNILVTLHDGKPVPKVIDFGIAKATNQQLTDKTVYTEMRQFVGTPAYMSPEQAEMSGLDIDIRSDIYSLGVLLYELLTGQTPFSGSDLVAAGLEAMRRVIREKEPPRPSTRLSTMLASDLTTIARQRSAAVPKLIHFIKGDLDWIVMKSLEKDRVRRYESASSFAADVERFLKNEPVAARPPSAAYRFQKMAARNKLLFTSACAVLLAILGGLGVSTWMFFQEQKAYRAADREARRSQQVARFLEEMLAGVGPDVARGRDTQLLRDILDKTVERVTQELKDQPEVQAEICNTIGGVYRALGLYHKSEELHRGARALQGRNPSGSRAAMATSLNDLALVLRDQGKLPESESLQREALALRRQIYGDKNSDVADSMNNLSLVLRSEDKLAEAENLQRDALAMQKKLFGARHLAVATSLSNLALDLQAEGKLPEAEAAVRESLSIQTDLSGKTNPGVGITLDNLAFILRGEGKLDEAEQVERQSLDLQRKMFGEEHPSVATSLNNLALILKDQGHLERAESFCRQALAIRRKMPMPAPPELAACLDTLGGILRQEKQFAEAQKMALEGLAIRRTIYGQQQLPVAASLNTVGLILHDEGKLEESETTFRAALMMQKKLLTEDHPAIAATLSNLAITLRDDGKLAEAEAAVRNALAVRQKVLGPNHPLVADCKRDLAKILALEENGTAVPRKIAEAR